MLQQGGELVRVEVEVVCEGGGEEREGGGGGT
jgi:hypothetical protein